MVNTMRGKHCSEQLLTTEHTEIVSQPVVPDWLEKSNDSKMLGQLIIMSGPYDMGTAYRNAGGWVNVSTARLIIPTNNNTAGRQEALPTASTQEPVSAPKKMIYE